MTPPPASSSLSVEREIVESASNPVRKTTQLDDTWVFTGTTWTRLHTATSPPAQPSVAAYDAARGQLILVAGSDSANGISSVLDVDLDGANLAQACWSDSESGNKLAKPWHTTPLPDSSFSSGRRPGC